MNTEIDLKHLTREELEAALDEIRQSPRDQGMLELIVRRPQIDAREVLEEGELHLLEGLVGDSWRTRGSSRRADGSSHPLLLWPRIEIVGTWPEINFSSTWI
jgi:hypothetical protein